MAKHTSRNTILVAALIASFLPVWRSGGKTGLNFWELIWNHSVLAEGPLYVPEEDYRGAFLAMKD